MASERHEATTAEAEETDDVERPINLEMRLMYSAIEGNLDGIKELLDSDVNVNFKDNDGRTAVSLLLDCSSELDPSDCLSGFRNLNT